MFFFFKDNYMWSQATARALGTGASAGEIAEVLEVLQPHSAEGAVEAWFKAWNDLGDHVYDYGSREAADGHEKSAGQSFLRACSYYQWATNFMSHTDERRLEAHRKSIDAFGRFAASRRPKIERVELQFEGDSILPGWFVPGHGDEQRKPTVLFLSGMDATKEQGFPFAQELQERGFNIFLVDGPGVVEALLFSNLPNRYDEEVAGGVFIDYLLARDDVDAERLAIVGISFGGYRVTRIAAFDDRVKAMVAWGAQWDRYEWVKQRMAEGQWKNMASPPDHFLHAMGAKDFDELLEILKNYRLDEVAPKITCPMLVTHGVHDKQLPVDYAYKLYEAASSTQKELKIFTDETGGTMHCQNDNRLLAYTYVSDWLEDTLVHGKVRTGVIEGWDRR